jgi:hypothetical protein
MPFKWVPNAAETLADSHEGHFGFCPANSQFYRVVVKPPPDFGVSWFGQGVRGWLETLGRPAVTG